MNDVLNPAVSAIVVNFNGGQEVLMCVDNLLQLGEQLQRIIVIDNGSSDGSLAELMQLGSAIDLVPTGENLGPSAARNRGIARASTPWVLLIDDDVYLDNAGFATLARCLSSTPAVIVVPRLLLMPEGLVQADGADVHFIGSMQLRNGRQMPLECDAQRREIGTFSSSCLLAERQVLLDVGAFDESFFIYQEDMELGLRLRSCGYTLMCEPAAVALHERGAGTEALSFRDSGPYPRRRALFTMRNRLQMILMHYRGRSLVLLLPALLAFEIASIVFAVRSGWFSAWVEAWQWQWRHRAEIRQKRRAIQERRTLPDAELLQGGKLPLAPGLLSGGMLNKLVKLFSAVLDLYWKAVRRLL